MTFGLLWRRTEPHRKLIQRTRNDRAVKKVLFVVDSIALYVSYNNCCFATAAHVPLKQQFIEDFSLIIQKYFLPDCYRGSNHPWISNRFSVSKGVGGRIFHRQQRCYHYLTEGATNISLLFSCLVFETAELHILLISSQNARLSLWAFAWNYHVFPK
jgi:hypothetical protein